MRRTRLEESKWKLLGIPKSTYYKRLKINKTEAEKLIEDYIQYRDSGLHEKTWSASYRRNIPYQIRKFLQGYSDVSEACLKAWLSELPPVKHSARSHRHAAISSLARYLCRLQRISEDEYRRIKDLCPKKPPDYVPKKVRITEEQLDKILTYLLCNGESKDEYLITRILSSTALRASEYCQLTWQDLKFSEVSDEAYIEIRKGKGGKRRIVPFPRKLQNHIMEVGYLPESTPRTLADMFLRISSATSIKVTCHSLRHYRITKWANDPKIPIVVTSNWAGHSDLKVTQGYIHVPDKQGLSIVFDSD